jgi:hypothetical protein
LVEAVQMRRPSSVEMKPDLMLDAILLARARGSRNTKCRRRDGQKSLAESNAAGANVTRLLTL